MKSETARIPSKLIFSPGGEGGGEFLELSTAMITNHLAT